MGPSSCAQRCLVTGLPWSSSLEAVLFSVMQPPQALADVIKVDSYVVGGCMGV